LVLFLSLGCSAAKADDGHSVASIRQALESPIPNSALQAARQFDDELLRTGTAQGMRITLIVDERLKRVQTIVARLLTSLDESPQQWVVRVLDAGPDAVNAFVAGGRYIYIYTALLDAVRSDDELAVVLGHELGHSVLQHRTRAGHDSTEAIANMAALVGQLAGGRTQQRASTLYQTLHNGYSRDDEREADAFGALIAWRSKFDPVAGAAFFSRLQQTQDAKSAADAAAETKMLQDYKGQALAVKAKCETGRQQWASGQAVHTQQNADLINGWCNTYKQAADAYNSRVASDAAPAPAPVGGSDHPENLERVAAIAAEADFLRKARDFHSLADYPASQRVLAALSQVKSPLIVGKHRDPPAAVPASGSSESGSSGSEESQSEAQRASQEAIAAERERIAKARAEEQQAAKKQALSKCKRDDDQCRRMAWQ
jgi:hypothetical protein